MFAARNTARSHMWGVDPVANGDYSAVTDVGNDERRVGRRKNVSIAETAEGAVGQHLLTCAQPNATRVSTRDCNSELWYWL